MLRAQPRDKFELAKRAGIPALIFMINLVLLIRQEPYFWDTIQFGSLHPEYFIRTDFTSFLLPDEIDSGHPPFFGMYIAMMWKNFGRSLAVSHFSMIPFLLIFTFFTVRLAQLLVPSRLGVWLIALVLLDTTFLAQATLVSPDVWLSAFFVMTLYGIMAHKRPLILIGSMLLTMVSMRGMMVVAGLIVYEVLHALLIDRKKGLTIFEAVPSYLLSILFTIAFLTTHYLTKGWIGYHPDSPWAPSFQWVSPTGFVRNVFLWIWRLVDFGHLFIVVLTMLLWVMARKLPQVWARAKPFFLLSLVMMGVTLPLLLYQNLLAHRYFLPLYFTLAITGIVALDAMPMAKIKASLLAMVCALGMLTGNLWNYPLNVDRGWDASLAYLPYGNLMDQAKNYIDYLGLPYSMIGSAFPNLRSEYFTHLSDNRRLFKEKDLDTDRYILYSNVMNDFSKEEIETLYSQWEVLNMWHKGAVEVILFKR
ncbi:MAG: hypothetical protein R2806_08210 [Saprospiraceae bacterium]